MDLTPEEIRVLGCLVEKQRTTPEAYPLSINALRLACNQSTNRDPVLELDERTVRDALERLARRRWVRLASGAGSRATKYRHLLEEALGLAVPELSVLAVLMLRGPQTPGELRSRTERLHRFAGQADLIESIELLIRRDLAVRLERRPGQKEERYAQVLGGEEERTATPAATLGGAPGGGDGLEERVQRLERELGELRAAVERLRSELGVAP